MVHRKTYIVELDDVWVSDFLEDCDFAIDSLKVGMVLDFLLLKDLYRDLYCNKKKTQSNKSYTTYLMHG